MLMHRILPVYDQRKEYRHGNKEYTTVCRSILQNKTCDYGEKCRFAHVKSDLRRIYCHQGDVCSNQSCVFWHTETIDEYCDRLQLPFKN